MNTAPSAAASAAGCPPAVPRCSQLVPRPSLTCTAPCGSTPMIVPWSVHVTSSRIGAPRNGVKVSPPSARTDRPSSVVTTTVSGSSGLIARSAIEMLARSSQVLLSSDTISRPPAWPHTRSCRASSVWKSASPRRLRRSQLSPHTSSGMLARASGPHDPRVIAFVDALPFPMTPATWHVRLGNRDGRRPVRSGHRDAPRASARRARRALVLLPAVAGRH